MTCFHPLTAFRMDDGSILFKERGKVHSTLSLPCGQCHGCRKERARQWAVRCVHEAQLWEANCFVTLTYNDENLPEGNSLCYKDFQLFMRRLRRTWRKPVRFFMCGEYGEEGARPHYHALLFNFNFADRVFLADMPSGCRTYRSPTLERLWPHGFSSIGDVTFESAGYVARYVMKKVTGPAADQFYASVNVETGEVFQRMPEFCHMSLKPGIAKLWLGKYFFDVFPRGHTVVNGQKGKAPRYYDKLYKAIDPDAFEELCSRREEVARERVADNTPERLAVREQVSMSRAQFLKRTL